MTDHLQLGRDSLMFGSMKNYLPGLGLLDYFFERCYSIKQRTVYQRDSRNVRQSVTVNFICIKRGILYGA